MEPDVDDIGRHRVPEGPVGGIGLADRDAVCAQARRDLLVEPRFVAELDRVTHAAPAPQRANEGLETAGIPVEIARQLPDDRGELRAEPRGAVALEADGRQRILEFLVVRQIAVRLDGEAELRRRLAAPALEGRFGLQPVEGGIRLDRGEPLRTETEPVLPRATAVESLAPDVAVDLLVPT